MEKSNTDRIILHCDCNNFFASVECFFRPELKQVPMAVGGSEDNRHGIILAKNEKAKKFGVKTAETIWQAKKKCPQLVIVPPHHGEYLRFSEKINQIYRDYTDYVEPCSIDESWLDVTGSTKLFGSGQEIADQLRKRVREEIGVTISVGVSFNKIFAKMGSDYKKPDATTVIDRENYRSILFGLNVSELISVGESSQKTLSKLGIKTIGDLAKASEEMLVAYLGKQGKTLHAYANGNDDRPVAHVDEEREVKSIGNSMTFRRDLCKAEEIRAGVIALSDSVAARLRRHALKAGTVQVTIRDPNFKTITRQKTLSAPTFLAKEISTVALQIIRASWTANKPIRLLGVTCSGLMAENVPIQLSLFEKEASVDAEKQEKVEKAMDEVRKRFGMDSVSYGTVVGNALGIRLSKDPTITDKDE